MKYKESISQLHKNIILYFFAFSFIIMAFTIYLLNQSSIDLVSTTGKVAQAIENPESIRRRYDSEEDYIVALEEQVKAALNRDQEILNEEIEFLDILFKALLVLGICQLVILSLPIKSRDSNN